VKKKKKSGTSRHEEEIDVSATKGRCWLGIQCIKTGNLFYEEFFKLAIVLISDMSEAFIITGTVYVYEFLVFKAHFDP
jgi:hypothetical protein